MIASMIEKLDQIFRKVKPNGVIVFGDTNSSLSAAISAKKSHSNFSCRIWCKKL